MAERAFCLQAGFPDLWRQQLSARAGSVPSALQASFLCRHACLCISSMLRQVCLICLDALEPEDFESGEAIVLECACRGELALRHRTCAEKWARVKVRALQMLQCRLKGMQRPMCCR